MNIPPLAATIHFAFARHRLNASATTEDANASSERNPTMNQRIVMFASNNARDATHVDISMVHV
jgi:hypothetical protein